VLADVITHPEMLAVARLLLGSWHRPGTRPGQVSARFGFAYPGCPHPVDRLRRCLFPDLPAGG